VGECGRAREIARGQHLPSAKKEEDLSCGKYASTEEPTPGRVEKSTAQARGAPRSWIGNGFWMLLFPLKGRGGRGVSKPITGPGKAMKPIAGQNSGR